MNLFGAMYSLSIEVEAGVVRNHEEALAGMAGRQIADRRTARVTPVFMLENVN